MIIYTPPKPATSIPLIDLAGTVEDCATAVHRACRETGFFYIANHGVSADLVAAQFAAAGRFFDLPIEEKMRIDMKKSPTTAGYEPMGGQRLDSQDPLAEKAPPDLKETFYCGVDLPDEHPLAQKKWRGVGHNQWPDLQGFREQTVAYHSAMCALGDRVLGLIARSLDMPADWFKPFYEGSGAMVRLIKYPPHPASAAFNQLGAGAHTDWGGIALLALGAEMGAERAQLIRANAVLERERETPRFASTQENAWMVLAAEALAQDAAGGLEIETTSGEWIAAKPIPDTFVINLGDLMARWTNGIYTSNLHRVKNNLGGRDRYSLPFFYSPRYDAVIDAIPTCITPEHPRLYPPCACSDHMMEMFRRSYGYAPAA